ncbi:MAG: histidine triad nucleotide-binding protein [Candidatus Competibacteraceae bacterium]|jgi:histidine triad (HIT) family protein|nr:histidine triad nucleotide-binding protein [Candidatus Competibacteraceae bacterium]
MSETVFSKIIAREIPADIVYEDDQVLAFRDINPQAPVHIVIIPKKPIPTLNDLIPDDAELIGQLFLAAKQVAADLGVADSGYRTLINCNRDGGQDVFHVHMHLMAGRPMGWPPG